MTRFVEALIIVAGLFSLGYVVGLIRAEAEYDRALCIDNSNAPRHCYLLGKQP